MMIQNPKIIHLVCKYTIDRVEGFQQKFSRTLLEFDMINDLMIIHKRLRNMEINLKETF